jgi:hypothetical protein
MALSSSRILESAVVTITATAQTLEDMGLDAGNIAQADIAMITVEDPCRFTLNGDAPTDTVGHYLDAQVDREFPGVSLIKYMKIIRIGGSNIAGYITLAKL